MFGDGIVWIASYPKSGNTWLLSFLAAYLDAGTAPDIDELDIPISSARPILDEYLGINTADLSLEELRNLLPSAYSTWAKIPYGSRYVKTHECFANNSDGVPIFPSLVSRGVIYLVRDPRDVVVSLMHHNGTSLESAIRRLNSAGTWLGIGGGEQIDQIPQYVSDWSTHVHSWTSAPFSRLVLRYEDMLRCPEECFARVVKFCGMELVESRLAEAVGATQFARLKTRELESGFRGRPAAATAAFFRQGRAGAWREILSAAQADEVVGTHAVVMQRFGYEV
jgi:hypothetical protein